MKKADLLKTEHQVQLKWLSNQIAKIANDGKEFLNPNVSERAYVKLNAENMGLISNSDLEHFISIYLSKVGLKKLVTTLRVHRNRNFAQVERLQVEITKSNKKRLDELVTISGKTKIQIINQLILTANVSDFKRAEEQLDMKLK